MDYRLSTADGQIYFNATLIEGVLQLENTHHYEGAPGSPWIDAFYKINSSEFPHILTLFDLPPKMGIMEALKAISESGRTAEFDRLLDDEKVIIAEKSVWFSFDD